MRSKKHDIYGTNVFIAAKGCYLTVAPQKETPNKLSKWLGLQLTTSTLADIIMKQSQVYKQQIFIVNINSHQSTFESLIAPLLLITYCSTLRTYMTNTRGTHTAPVADHSCDLCAKVNSFVSAPVYMTTIHENCNIVIMFANSANTKRYMKLFLPSKS